MRSQKTEDRRQKETGSSQWVLIVLIGVTLAAMGRLCAMEFTWWDDNDTIHQNPLMNPVTWETIGHYWTHAYMGLYVPVTYMAWAGLAVIARVSTPDERAIALNPWVFHSANVLVHIVNVVIVYAILRRVVKLDWAAAAGALIFGVHPVQVETVGWVSGMKDLLCGMFVLGAVWQYLIYAQGKGNRLGAHYWAALGCTIVGTLCKPTAVVTPVLLTVVDRWVVGRGWREVARGVWPFAAAVVPCAVWAKVVQETEPKAAVWVRPMVAADAVAFYLWKLVWPARLAIDYGHNPAYVLSQWWSRVTWMVPVMVGAAIWMGRKRVIWAAGMLFVGGMLPVLGFTPFMFQAYSTTADHYLYLPMLGVAMAAAWGAARWRGRGMAAAVGIVVAGLALRSGVQAGVWENDETLNHHTISINPRSSAAHVNLAAALEYKAATQGDQAARDEAIAHLREAIRLRPETIIARENLAIILIERGENEEGIRLLLEAIAIADQVSPEERKPLGPSHHVLAAVLAKRGRYREAAEQYRAALEYQPGDAQLERELAAVERKSATTRASR